MLTGPTDKTRDTLLHALGVVKTLDFDSQEFVDACAIVSGTAQVVMQAEYARGIAFATEIVERTDPVLAERIRRASMLE